MIASVSEATPVTPSIAVITICKELNALGTTPPPPEARLGSVTASWVPLFHLAISNTKLSTSLFLCVHWKLIKELPLRLFEYEQAEICPQNNNRSPPVISSS